MTAPRMLSYIDNNSPIHSLCGATKLIVFLLWSILVMVSFKTPILLALAVLGIVFFTISKIRFSDISFIVKIMVLFMGLNLAAILSFFTGTGRKNLSDQKRHSGRTWAFYPDRGTAFL